MTSDTKFRINLKEGFFELEGNESFVDKHLEKFEEIFKIAIKEVIINNKENIPKLDVNNILTSNNPISLESFPSESDKIHLVKNKNGGDTSTLDMHTEVPISSKSTKHSIPKLSVNIPPLPVDLKTSDSKPGLREFYKEKKPSNHYEKSTLFVYYLTKYNKQTEIKFGEILSCYEEINEKKPSVIDIVKNSIRYKGWLEPGSEKYSARLTISGENYIKFDLPKT
ncbi:hypothetical protein YTPLAS21_05400 [Candidatus Nitrosocosmicus sp.]|nr:hypothetical protein YTPLAS21_05400 [Candidatus Nitrosocosmicus sp.]